MYISAFRCDYSIARPLHFVNYILLFVACFFLCLAYAMQLWYHLNRKRAFCPQDQQTMEKDEKVCNTVLSAVPPPVRLCGWQTATIMPIRSSKPCTMLTKSTCRCSVCPNCA